MPMHHIDLNALESFSFLYKNLWSLDTSKRAKVNIVDTILFKDGLPYMWLFTSDKTGVSDHLSCVFFITFLAVV